MRREVILVQRTLFIYYFKTSQVVIMVSLPCCMLEQLMLFALTNVSLVSCTAAGGLPGKQFVHDDVLSNSWFHGCGCKKGASTKKHCTRALCEKALSSLWCSCNLQALISATLYLRTHIHPVSPQDGNEILGYLFFTSERSAQR